MGVGARRQVEAVFMQTSLARALVAVHFDREVTGFGAEDLELENVRLEDIVHGPDETNIAYVSLHLLSRRSGSPGQ